MRVLALVLLWLGVAGFGLMTLCSGLFVPTAAIIAVPFGCVVGLLTWLCWRGIQRMKRPDGNPDEPAN